MDETDAEARGEKLMVAANWNNRIPPDGFDALPPANWLARRVRYYFDQHPEVSRQEFLLEAVRREIHFREQKEARRARRQRARAGRLSFIRPPLSAEDLRLHALLSERLAALHYERHGLLPKLRRLLFGNRLARWLGAARRE
jgi:hypothetical protein